MKPTGWPPRGTTPALAGLGHARRCQQLPIRLAPRKGWAGNSDRLARVLAVYEQIAADTRTRRGRRDLAGATWALKKPPIQSGFVTVPFARSGRCHAEQTGAASFAVLEPYRRLPQRWQKAHNAADPKNCCWTAPSSWA